jgi:serine/threonine-protein kinase
LAKSSPVSGTLPDVDSAPALATKVCPACSAKYPQDALFCPNDGAPLQSSTSSARSGEGPDPYLGREISGHIEVKQLAGVGAMGRVYRAFQKGIDRDVAVKVLHRELSANTQLVTRFTREAKVASRLQHPNVVQVLLAGQLPDGAMYIVMEFLDGMSLQSALAASSGAMPLGRAMHIGLQLCDAVGEAHAQGIVHRDLKPENVMLVRRGEDLDFVKVLDFGIARINWGEQSMATAAGLIFGTARYISPEGAQGEGVNPPGDVYSIATLLYQMLSGRTPFEGDQAVAMLLAQIHDTPPPLRSHTRAAYVPEPIADVIMANLAKNPASRLADARAFGRALAEAALRGGLASEDIGPLAGFGRRPSGVMKLASLERTKKHEISADDQDRMARPPAAPSAPEGRRPSGTEIPSLPGPGSATVRWTPPDALPAVEDTLDDEPAPRARAAPATALSPASPPSAPRAAPSSSSRERERESRPRSRESSPTVPSPAGEDGPTEKSGRASLVTLVLVCFVVGVLLSIGVAYKMGRIGPDRALEAEIARANAALMAHRLYEPPGDNVREITALGLQRWPHEPHFLEAREKACDELVNLARVERNAPESLRVAKIATDLDPSDPAAKRLVEELESELAKLSPDLPGSVAPLASTPKPPTFVPTPSSSAPSTTTVDASPASPRVGQTVTFVARVSPAKAKVSDASFTVQGATLAAARMPAAPGANGTFRGGFAFLEAGTFQIVFTATVDGVPTRAERTVVTTGSLVPGLPPTAPTAPVPQPQPSGSSSRWL